MVTWKHGDAWAIRTKDWSKRMYGFASRVDALKWAAINW